MDNKLWSVIFNSKFDKEMIESPCYKYIITCHKIIIHKIGHGEGWDPIKKKDQ